MQQPTWWPEIKVVVWDLDGTLYPSKKAMTDAFERESFRQVAKILGISEPEAQRQFVELRSELKSNTKTLGKFGIDGRKFFTDLWDTFPVEQHIDPNPNFVSLLKNSKLRHRILSNSNRLDQVEKKIGLIGFEPTDFEAIQTSVTLGIEKPDPRCFRAVEYEADVAPGAILMVGDRMEVDVLPAQSVGWHGCLVRSADERADLCLELPERLFELETSVLEKV